MAFATKDGKQRFGSAFRAKKYDSFHAAEPEGREQQFGEKKEADQSSKAQPQTSKEEAPAAEHQAPHEVVAAHGKAHSVSIHHDHANNTHKVISHHEDGHMHESQHDSADEAHDHGKQLAGADEDALEGESQEAENQDASNDIFGQASQAV